MKKPQAGNEFDAKAIEAAIVDAKPSTAAFFAAEYQAVLFKAKGKFDIAETTIMVPLPALLQLVGGLMSGVVGPVMSQIPRREIGGPPVDLTKIKVD